MAKTRKLTVAQARKAAKPLLAEMKEDAAKAKREGQFYQCLSERELMDKLTGKTSNSPYVYAILRSGRRPSEEPDYVVLRIHNPDPADPQRPGEPAYNVVASGFFGAGANTLSQENFMLALALSANNPPSTSWYATTSRSVLLRPDERKIVSFHYRRPDLGQPGQHILNIALWEDNRWWQGRYFDRAWIPIDPETQ